jgi:hypothetical protein
VTAVLRHLDHLSPPEAEHVLLELPAERAAYVGLVAEITGWPDRSPLVRRVPAEDEIAALRNTAGRWRAVTLLDDETALKMAVTLVRRVFVLDPLYDTGDLLYAAWHDPSIKAEHARRLAQQGALLVRAAPVLRDGTAVLAPDHLPGSWDPRPGWRQPRPDADESARQAWALRTGLVLLYWADRLDALVCLTRADVVAMLRHAFGHAETWRIVRLPPPSALDQRRADLAPQWATARRLTRRRALSRLDEMGRAVEQIGCAAVPGSARDEWRLALGRSKLPDPALLLRRVMNGVDPNRTPPLPPTSLRRRPLCLTPTTYHDP